MHVTTEYYKFNLELKMYEVIIFAKKHTPSVIELHNYPHTVLTSPHPWNPHDVNFHRNARYFKVDVNQMHDISSVNCNVDYMLFNIGTIENKVINSVRISNANVKRNINSVNNNIPLQQQLENLLYIGTTDLCNNQLFSILDAIFQYFY